ncbi:MAG: terminase family protein, partial [Candidatus Bathyarchaeota archaeon]|nr:terminase family protein [Candidatus Bathyarchaeota archaeon]
MIPSVARRARTWHKGDYDLQRQYFREEAKVLDESKKAAVDQVKGDTAKFFSDVCKLRPFWYQLELAKLYRENQFLAVRWPRQTGKSTSIGALLLQDAYENPDLYIGFIGPSWRQTKLNIRRVASFCRNLPAGEVHVQKTRISFSNGSVIEAFPNNPDTVRGNTFHRLYWDECGFTPNDEDLYDAILFTLGTTNGKLIVSSTPFNSDSLFWKMCNHRDYSDFARHHFSWEKALA